MKTDHPGIEVTYVRGATCSKDSCRRKEESGSVALVHKVCVYLRPFSQTRRRRDLRSDLYVMF